MPKNYTIESLSINEAQRFSASVGDEALPPTYQIGLTIKLESAADATDVLRRLHEAGIKLQGAR